MHRYERERLQARLNLRDKKKKKKTATVKNTDGKLRVRRSDKVFSQLNNATDSD